MLQQTLWHNHQLSTLRSDPLPAIGNGQLLVEARYSLVSSGSERLVLSQKLAGDTATRMQVPYMQGDFSSSFTYGYSLTGTVLRGPAQWTGRRVHLLHPHQRYAIVDCNDACLLPDTLDLAKATLISNLETALTAVWDSRVSIGDRVAVFGYGIIGTLLCELLKTMPGTELHVVEPNTLRAGQASTAGLSVLPGHEDLPALDIAFNCAASASALQQAIDAIGFEGRVIELSWYGERSSEIKLGGSFHYDRKQIISSQVSSIPGHKPRRWNHASRKALVLHLLEDIDATAVIDKRVAFSQSAEFFNSLRTQIPAERGIVLDYQE